MWQLDIGASIIDRESVRFRVWAPFAKKVSVRILSGRHDERLKRNNREYFEGVIKDVHATDRYLYVIDDGIARPDPASRWQPEGVHGPSQIVDPQEFFWKDNDWKGIPLADFIIYELHVGTFTRQGTFEAIIDHLDYFRNLGITAIELMPVSQFAGDRNWGYDGVYPFAPQNSYGGPAALKRLVSACHSQGFAVVLDVVCNHLGPEGNYLASFAPYFTDRYKSPWGDAINFDGPYSDEVRHYFVANVLYWITEYHIDALRLDAIQGVFDFSAQHFLHELTRAVHSLREVLGRHVHVIAESDLNDVKVLNPPGIGGYGLDAQWSDDFHHALHTLVTGETNAYYSDFGKVTHLAKAFSDGFVYSGQYSRYRKQKHGNSSRARPPHQFVVCSQNHDQAGNRLGRLSLTLSLEQLKLAAGVVLLSPFIPLLFMGEEYAEKAPFPYFVSFLDHSLIAAVREGRQKEFAIFGWPSAAPDPHAEATFLSAKIDVKARHSPRQVHLYSFYRALIDLRKKLPLLASCTKERLETMAFEDERMLFLRIWGGVENLCFLYNFSETTAGVGLLLPAGRWMKAIDSSRKEWGGNGELAPPLIDSREIEARVDLNPHSFVLYRAGMI
jgi:maltooligosyltrehalose trehalohydrolase